MKTLADALAENSSKNEVDHFPFVVSCRYCGMTMWSTSDNAFVNERDDIVCKSCGGQDA